MLTVALVLSLLLTLGLAGLCAWLLLTRTKLAAEAGTARAESARSREDRDNAVAKLEAINADIRSSLDEARQRAARLEAHNKTLTEERARLEAWIADEKNAIRAAFGELSTKALDASSKRFLELAEQRFNAAKEHTEAELDKRRRAVDDLVKPIGETLERTRQKLEAIEKARTEHFATLGEQIKHVTTAGLELKDETSRLTNALSRPEVRGQYGEIQLRRVAELAGMTSYCDFSEQTTAENAAGDTIRPDMIVNLPNDRVIAVDAKTNAYAYLEAVNARSDDERESHLDRFARHVAEQAKKLSQKRYWTGWDGGPDFVVMFVPGDHFIDAALARRPDLLEVAASQNVILASPSTLIGLLRAVAVGWREKEIAENGRELKRLGAELHKRSAKAFEHIAEIGKALSTATERYNRAIGSIETRLTPTLRKFEALHAESADPLPELPPVEIAPRPALKPSSS